MPSSDNPFEPFLTENPEYAYFGYQNQWQTPNMKKYFQSQFGNIQNQYKGQLGQQAMQGIKPILHFTDFLKNVNWGQEYGQQTPQQRGQDTSRFSPFTRWMT